MDAWLISKLQDNHIAAWNERDRTGRDTLLRAIYSEEIKMYDPERIFGNLTEISDFIGSLHAKDPDFLFSTVKEADVTQNGVRLYGHIGTKQNPALLNSMDFFIIENEKVAHLYVFIEPAS